MQDPETTAELDSRIMTAMALMPDQAGEDRLDLHCRAELEWVLSRIQYSDLTTTETMALLAILCPVHARVIGPHAGPNRPRLRVLHAAPNFLE